MHTTSHLCTIEKHKCLGKLCKNDCKIKVGKCYRETKVLKKLTHIGVKYDESSSNIGKNEALKVLIKVPKQSPT